MWFGVLYLDADETKDEADGPIAIVHAYAVDGVFTVGGHPDMAPVSIRLLRSAAGGGRLQTPCCRDCGEPLEVPPLDVEEGACASA